jgi:glycine dehydrogenase
MNFLNRHVGNSKNHILKILNLSESEIISKIIPSNILSNFKDYPHQSETHSLNKLENMMAENKKFHSMIGLDFSESNVPNVIKRNLLENPKWYTAYTPYQAEISQGRLESLFNFQTLITELTNLPISNCSLLDTGSASVEALNMAFFHHKERKNRFFVDKEVHPHLMETMRTRANILDLDFEVGSLDEVNIDNNLFGVYFSNPNTYGKIEYMEEIVDELKKNNSTVISHNDILSLLVMKPPGDYGIDISIGSTQRLGLPLWYGGPHSCYLDCREEFLRLVPGRIIGKSIDRHNKEAFRMALQTREQHIRKDRATSNICTAQALLANTSTMYAIYHGKEGLIKISKDILQKTNHLKNLIGQKYKITEGDVFSSFLVKLPIKEANNIYLELLENGIEVRKLDIGIVINVNETTELNQINNILEVFGVEFQETAKIEMVRHGEFLEQEIFKNSKSETEMMRYMDSLVSKDYSLVNGMIPLGSCTMKLNATMEMEPLSWDSVQHPHPYSKQTYDGYEKMISELGERLLDITGMNAVSFQTNAGSMGEYAGLLCIKKYHKEIGENRDICLIPESAHGTNFTSARLAKLKIKKYSDDISIEDFREMVESIKDNLSSLMITYPNTYGIFDENIKEIIDIIHDNGGLVYMDGANMNAQCGFTSPGECGADVCHLNLHKTFCIPHGGGGPGMGPILVNDKLSKFLPSNIYQDLNYFDSNTLGMVTNSNYSSASILTIPYLYLTTLGTEGLKEATRQAIISANYLKIMLEDEYKVYSSNKYGLVGHEFIIDLREFKQFGITEKDVAKRLLDYSFHPPTMSWPIPGSIMIEPTESENIEELDRFILAMRTIREEIREIEKGEYPKENNVLVNSPHCVRDLLDWKFEYSTRKGCFPVEYLEKNKFWPTNSRIDDVYGDKNLILK